MIIREADLSDDPAPVAAFDVEISIFKSTAPSVGKSTESDVIGELDCFTVFWIKLEMSIGLCLSNRVLFWSERGTLTSDSS